MDFHKPMSPLTGRVHRSFLAHIYLFARHSQHIAVMQTRTVSTFKPAVGLRPLVPAHPCSRRPLAAVCSARKQEQDDQLQTLPQKWALPLAAAIAGART